MKDSVNFSVAFNKVISQPEAFFQNLFHILIFRNYTFIPLFMIILHGIIMKELESFHSIFG
jgi:hypothetical protein